MPDLPNRILAVLFVSGEPLAATRLAETLEVPQEDVMAAVVTLQDRLAAGPLRVTVLHQQLRLVTAASYAFDINRFMQAQAKTDLSRPALETLAIVAYRGPITRSAVETIRGVSSEIMLRNLLQRDLIEQQGTASEPGRPPMYVITQACLQALGLESLDQLQPLSADIPAAA